MTRRALFNRKTWVAHFGTKAPLYREEIVATHLAMTLRRPVKWVENRVESLTNLGQERDQIHYVE